MLANNVGRKAGHYHTFFRYLARRGLVLFTRRKLGGVTVFFVRKKTGQLRMIIDARVVYTYFKRSPPVHGCSPEILADLECVADDVVYSATIDIKDYVHRLRLDLRNSHRRIILETDADADGVEIYEMRDH